MKMLLSLIFIFSTEAMAVVPVAKAAVAKAATKAAEPAKVERRNYSEEEFKKAVLVEVEKTMKRAGSGNLIEFSKELMDKEEQLKVKELEIQKGQDQLKLNQADFQKKVLEFQDSQKKFLGCVDAQNEKAEKRIGQMVEVISGMKPQNAADVLAVQDPDLSVRILAQLDTSKASKIFNLMDKEVSARLQKQFLLMKK
jgi:flagellar motility protein MotE (MotC chaperone)